MSDPSVRVLVVDDSPAMRRHIIGAISRLAGVGCEEATDGVDGLKKVTSVRFDLVVTDINMPLMDGLKLVAAVRQRAETAAVPIVVITTETSPADRQRALDLGANAYLVKPVQAPEVVSTVRVLLGL